MEVNRQQTWRTFCKRLLSEHPLMTLGRLGRSQRCPINRGLTVVNKRVLNIVVSMDPVLLHSKLLETRILNSGT